MIKYLRFSLGILLVTIMYCSPKQTSQALRVNLSDIQNISIDQWFSSVEIIPLETVDSSLLHECSHIEYYHERYYVFDRRQQAVFVFDTTGKFLFNTLSSIGRGPGQYVTNMGIAINRTTGNLEVLDWHARKIRIFNKDGIFINDFSFPEEIVPIREFRSLSAELYLFYVRDWKKNRECINVYDVTEQRVVKRMLMMNSYEDNFVSTSRNAFYWMDTTLCFSHTYANNDIYQIGASLDFQKLYSYDFGNKTFNSNALPKSESPQFYKSFDRDNKDRYAFPALKFESKDYHFCFFLLNDLLYISRHHKGRSGGHTKGDVVYTRFDGGGMIFPPILFAKQYLYNVIEPSWIPYMMNPLFSDCQKELLGKIKEDDNPLLLKYRYK